jgi:hypothetical protein
MKNMISYIGGLAFCFLTGCASLGGIKTAAEAKKYQAESLDADQINIELIDAASTIVANRVDTIQQAKKKTTITVPNHSSFEDIIEVERGSGVDKISATQLDSLKQKLQTDGTITVDSADAYLIDYLRTEQAPDTIFLANLHVETGKRGIPIAFQYQVNKNDQIFFEFENQKSKKIQKIEIIEGNESRFNHVNLKKKKKVNGSLTIQSDNTMTINVLKKGFFRSVVKMKIRKLSKAKEYSIKMVKDTLIETRTVVQEVIDTLFTKIDEKKYSLSPRLDITHASRIDFPISIDEVDNLIGWGYWIGLDKEDINNYDALAQTDLDAEPLIGFIKSELNLREDFVYLPRAQNPNLNLHMNKWVSDTPGLNNAKNFGYFTSDANSQNQKATIFVANKSKLYSYDISLMVVAVNLEYSKKEVEKEFYKEIPRIKLTLIH